MFILAHCILEEDGETVAPSLSFHQDLEKAKYHLCELARVVDLKSNSFTRVEFEEDGTKTEYRFFDTGRLHHTNEQLWSVATITMIPGDIIVR